MHRTDANLSFQLSPLARALEHSIVVDGLFYVLPRASWLFHDQDNGYPDTMRATVYSSGKKVLGRTKANSKIRASILNFNYNITATDLKL